MHHISNDIWKYVSEFVLSEFRQSAVNAEPENDECILSSQTHHKYGQYGDTVLLGSKSAE